MPASSKGLNAHANPAEVGPSGTVSEPVKRDLPDAEDEVRFGAAEGSSGEDDLSWFFGDAPGGKPLFAWWDKLDAYTNFGRNWFHGTPGSEKRNFPQARGFNAVFVDTQGYSMGPRSNPFRNGTVTQAPAYPGEVPFTEPANNVATRSRNYLRDHLGRGTGTEALTDAIFKLPEKEVLWAAMLWHTGQSDPFFTIREFLTRFLDASDPAVPVAQVKAILLSDEPEIVRRLPMPERPSAERQSSLPYTSFVPRVTGVSSDAEMIGATPVRFRFFATNTPYSVTWNFGGGATPNVSTALSPSVTLAAVPGGFSNADFVLTVTVENWWGSSTFTLPYTIWRNAGDTKPQITGVSSLVGTSGTEQRLKVHPAGGAASGFIGGHGQMPFLIPHVLGEFDGPTATWQTQTNGFAELGRAEGLSPGAIRVSLPAVNSPEDAPVRLEGDISVSNANGVGGPFAFKGNAVYEPVLAYPHWLTAAFFGVLVDEVRRHLVSIGRPMPLIVNHSSFILADRFYGRDENTLLRVGNEERNHAGAIARDVYDEPSKWRLQDSATETATTMHSYDEYPFVLADLEGPYGAAELNNMASLRSSIPTVQATIRLAIRQRIFPEDFIRPLQKFELLDRGKLRIAQTVEGESKMDIHLTNINPPQTSSEGLNFRWLERDGGLNQKEALTPRLPLLFWCQAWGQPFENTANTAPNANRNIATDADSVDPEAPPPDIDWQRLLRKPAFDGPSDLTSDEARRQVYHALFSGAHGVGFFNQFWVSDKLLETIWQPIVWEIMDYEDLRWNRTIFSKWRRGGSISWKTDSTPPTTATPPLWLPPKLGLVRRQAATTYKGPTGATVTRPADQDVLFLLNRSSQTVAFRLPDLHEKLPEEFNNPAKAWVRYKYGGIDPDVAGHGQVTVPSASVVEFRVPPYEVWIYRYE